MNKVGELIGKRPRKSGHTYQRSTSQCISAHAQTPPRLLSCCFIKIRGQKQLKEEVLCQRIIVHQGWEGMATGREGVVAGAGGWWVPLYPHSGSRERKASFSPGSPGICNLSKNRALFYLPWTWVFTRVWNTSKVLLFPQALASSLGPLLSPQSAHPAWLAP